MTYTNFQTTLYVTEVLTSLRSTYLRLNDGTTIKVADSILQQLKHLAPAKERMP